MFDGLPAEQFHQFIASASRASSTSPLIPPAAGLSAVFPFHDSASVVFDIHHHHHHPPFNNPNPTPPPPPLVPHHHLLHGHPTSSLILLPPPPHHNTKDARHEAEEEKDRSLLAMSVNFDPTAIDHGPWSNEEEVALLRIGSTIESWFPGSATWEHVSRKLAELGFKRSADKCKEKFEEQTLRSFNHSNNNNINININFSKNNNNYGLLVNELEDEIYDHRPHHHNPGIVPNDPPDIPPPVPQHRQIQDDGSNDIGDDDDDCENIEKPMENDGVREDEVIGGGGGDGELNDLEEVDSRPVETPLEIGKRRVSSLEEGKAAAKKRKMREERFETFKRFCESVVQRLMAQQEEMHAKLLDDMIRRDRELVEKEEAWKRMEMERVNKELDARAREHAATRDRNAAIIEFLKGFTSPPLLNTLQGPGDNDGDNDTENVDEPDDDMPSSVACPADHDILLNPPPLAPASSVPLNPSSSATFRSPRPSKSTATSGASDTGKRWPREEVLALINLRCNIQQGNNSREGGGAVDRPDHPQAAAKTPLWERISQAMSELGYERSAKRCKEKWENINKYFRKTKDSNVNKKRSIDSRTCPYFHQLNTLYMSQGKLATTAPEEERDATSSPHN